MGADLIATNPDLLARNPELGRMLGMPGFRPEPESSAIEVAALDVLKPAVENHVALKWHDRLELICGKRGMVKVQDDSDGTAQVTFAEQRPNIDGRKCDSGCRGCCRGVQREWRSEKEARRGTKRKWGCCYEWRFRGSEGRF